MYPTFFSLGVGRMVRVLGSGRPLQGATRNRLLEVVRRKDSIRRRERVREGSEREALKYFRKGVPTRTTAPSSTTERSSLGRPLWMRATSSSSLMRVVSRVPWRAASSTHSVMAAGRKDCPDRSHRCSVLSDMMRGVNAVRSSWDATMRNSSRIAVPRLAMEPRVVDGEGRPVRHLLRQLEIGAPVPARRARGQAEHPERLPAGHQRHGHPAARAQRADELTGRTSARMGGRAPGSCSERTSDSTCRLPAEGVVRPTLELPERGLGARLP